MNPFLSRNLFVQKITNKHFFILLILSFFCFSQTYGQDSTLQFLIQKSIENDSAEIPDNLDFQKIRADKIAATFGFDPLEITYNYGQINYEGMDYFISIDQTLPSIYRKVQINNHFNEVLKRELELQTLSKKQIIKDVCTQYNSQVSLLNKIDLLERLNRIYNLVKSNIENNEESYLDLYMLRGQQLKLKKTISDITTEIDLGATKLQMLTNTNTPTNIPHTLITYKNNFKTDSSRLLDSPEIKLQKIEIEKARIAINSKKGSLIPSYKIGYFYQSMYPIAGLQGLNVSIAIPLDYRSKQKSIESFIILEKIAKQKYESWLQNHFLAIESKVNKNIKLKNDIDTFISNGFENSTEIISKATQKLNEGNITPADYLEITTYSIEMEIEFLNLVKEYNETIFELEFLYGSHSN